MSLTTSLIRALLLHCPHCCKCKLFLRGFTMYERCPASGWSYEREEGYWTGAGAVNLVVTELLVTLLVVPLAVWLSITQQPITLLVITGLPLAFILPFVFSTHSKSFWMSLH